MTSHPPAPPYFDTLLDRLRAGDADLAAAFGRHVHWGWWPDADIPTPTPAEYGQAAERLCQRVCDAAWPTGDEEAAAAAAGVTRVLDVGCGFGGTVASLNERRLGLDLTGLNIDRRQLEFAAGWVRPREGNRVAWVEGDAEALPLPDASFDVVLAVECVFHFDRGRFLAEAARVLRPGGRLALSDFCPTAQALDYAGGDALWGDDAARRSYGRVDLTWSEREYQAAASQHGLTLVRRDDITRHTLPTYSFLLEHSAATRGPAGAANPHANAAFHAATRRLAKASRKGLVRYLVMAWEKNR